MSLCNTLHEYLLGTGRSAKAVGSRFRVSSYNPCIFYVSDGTRHSVGAAATHIGDILGCGKCGIMGKVRTYLARRFRAAEIREAAFNHACMGILQRKDFLLTVTQKTRTDELQLLPKSADLWKQGELVLGLKKPAVAKKLGELCWLATASRPDICACLAALAAKVNQLRVCDVHRINDLICAKKRCRIASS